MERKISPEKDVCGSTKRILTAGFELDD